MHVQMIVHVPLSNLVWCMYEVDQLAYECQLIFCSVIVIQVEDTCLVALATAYNAREAEGGITKQELLQYVEEVS